QSTYPVGGCGHKAGCGGHLSERDRCREGGRHHAAADAILTPAPKPAPAAAAAVAAARGGAAAAAVVESGTTPLLHPCGWQTSKWLTNPCVISTSCSRGVTGRCTRRSSSACTPAAATRHVTPTASACNLTAPLATPTPRPRRSHNSSCGHVSSGSGEGGNKGGQLRNSAPVEEWRGHNTRGRGYQAEVALDVLEGRLEDLDSELARWRLRRPVYGLRQVPLEWYDTLCSTLFDLGFQPSSVDPSLFVRRGSTPFFVLVYINDLVFATADRVALADVKLELQKRHTCTDLGELRHYPGLQITKDRAARTITLSQSHMVLQVLQRFKLQHSTVQRTPHAVDHRLTRPFPDKLFEPSGPYTELVGCLMYLMTCARPDLAFPLSILAHFVVRGRHRPLHWTAAVRVAKYLATTSGVGLVLGGRQDVVLTSHCDSSYADDAEMHRSTQGYCFSLGSGAVSWRSTRSSSVSTSTAEAEIYAGAMAAQKLRWLMFLLTDLS
ncbi:unnamed protein product, partial [Closterium sp. NIES-53]